MFKCYNEIKNERKIYKLRIESLKEELHELTKAADLEGPKVATPNYGGERLQGGPIKISYLTYLTDSEKIKEKIKRLDDRIKKINKQIKKMDTEFKTLSEKYDKTIYKVFYLHWINGKSLNEVSQILEMSYDWIVEVNGKINKQIKG